MKFRSRPGAVAALGVVALLAILPPASAQDSAATKQLPPVELHGFIQTYYRSGDPTIKDGFRLRKADLKFSGVLSPRLKWRLGFDAAKALAVSKVVTDIDDSIALRDATIDQKTRIVQDAALTYTVNRALSLDIGQQILPLSLEGTISTSQIETIERSMFIVERSRAVGLGDIRDVGVSANGRAFGAVEYHLGVFNETGEGAGTLDVNDQKAVIGRLAFHPAFLPRFQLGGSGGVEGGPAVQHRERAAGEAMYRDEHITVRAEAMSARDGLLRRFGWYTMSAVRPTKRLQFVARYDTWDRDLSGESTLNDASARQIVVGGSYLFDVSAKVAVNVIRQIFPNVSTPRDGTIILAAFQAVW